MMRLIICCWTFSLTTIAGCGAATVASVPASADAEKSVRHGFGDAEIAIAKRSAVRSVLPVVDHADADQAVLITCLNDVIASKKELLYNSPRHPLSPSVAIDFAVQPASYPMKVEHTLDDLKAEQWKSLTPAQRRGTSEAVGSLVQRIRSSSTFPNLTAIDGRIQIAPGAYDYSKEHSSSVIQAYRPGFSDDRSFAFVRIALPWSEHIGFVTYVLESKGGKWTILLRQSVYYA